MERDPGMERDIARGYYTDVEAFRLFTRAVAAEKLLPNPLPPPFTGHRLFQISPAAPSPARADLTCPFRVAKVG